MSEDKSPSLMVFPCDFPLKIMGLRAETFTQELVEVLLRHDPGFDAAGIEMRSSRTGKYLSLTASVYVHSQAQLDAVYRELSGHPLVKVVL